MSRRWYIFGIACSLFFLSQFYRVSNAVIAPQLLDDLAVDTKGLGLVSASFFYAFALTQIPISLLLDKVGPRSMMTTLSAVGIFGAVIFSWADSLAYGVTGRVLLGIGMSCNLMGTYKLLTLWFSPRAFATLAGLVVALGTAGNMVATTPLVILVDQMGWRSSFQLIAVINLILTLLFYVIVRDRPTENISDAPTAAIDMRRSFGNLRLLFAQKDYWIISIATFARYGIFAAFQALWAGPYLMEVMGYSALTTGNLILLLNIGMILGAPCWGTVSDRLFSTPKWIIVAGSICILSALNHSGFGPPRNTAGCVIGAVFLFRVFQCHRLVDVRPHQRTPSTGNVGCRYDRYQFFHHDRPGDFSPGARYVDANALSDQLPGPRSFQRGIFRLYPMPAVGAGIVLFYQRKAAGGLRSFCLFG